MAVVSELLTDQCAQYAQPTRLKVSKQQFFEFSIGLGVTRGALLSTATLNPAWCPVQHPAMLLPSLQRYLLPCLNGLDTASSFRDYSSSSSSLPDRPPGGVLPDAAADAGKGQQPMPHVSQLTQEQKQELKQAVIGR